MINLMIFSDFWGKIRLFLMSLWRALHWNATTPPDYLFLFCLIPDQTTEISNHIERFVWRLDCRLKYVCYLLLMKFVIFGYFWGKIRLFLMSLWRALQSGNSPVDFTSLLGSYVLWSYNHSKKVKYREVCVTVGLSSEVCLLPTSNKICDFWLFLG